MTILREQVEDIIEFKTLARHRIHHTVKGKHLILTTLNNEGMPLLIGISRDTIHEYSNESPVMAIKRFLETHEIISTVGEWNIVQ